jgi:hypothetical protein
MRIAPVRIVKEEARERRRPIGKDAPIPHALPVLTVLTMTMSASKMLIRYLGPSEAYFRLSNQNSWKHFVVATQITGETTTASWRTALALLIHPK